MSEVYKIYKSTLEAIGNAIRTRKGVTTKYDPLDMPDEIMTIGDIDVSGVTAEAGDVIAGKVIVDASGNEVTGTIPTYKRNEATELTLYNNYLYYRNIPVGYYTGTDTDTAPEIYASYSNVANKIGLTADKIVEGNTILGIAGTAVTNGGATGTFTSASNASVSVNVGFKPSVIQLIYKGNTDSSALVFVSFDSSNSSVYRMWTSASYFGREYENTLRDGTTTPTKNYGYIELTNTGFNFYGYSTYSGDKSVEYWCY